MGRSELKRPPQLGDQVGGFLQIGNMAIPDHRREHFWIGPHLSVPDDRWQRRQWSTSRLDPGSRRLRHLAQRLFLLPHQLQEGRRSLPLVVGTDPIDKHVPLPVVMPDGDFHGGDNVHATSLPIRDGFHDTALGVVVTHGGHADIVLGEMIDELNRCPDSIAFKRMQMQIDGIISVQAAFTGF